MSTGTKLFGDFNVSLALLQHLDEKNKRVYIIVAGLIYTLKMLLMFLTIYYLRDPVLDYIK